MIEIRAEHPGDAPAIRTVNERAFGQPEEGHIIERLRQSCAALVSLVAVLEDCIVGHILFSPVTIEGPAGEVEGMGLAPMAVLPEYQRQGIGSKLVETGLATLRKRGCPFVIVLGHADYYPRFGFERASTFGIRSQWDGVPDEAFMALILDPSTMQGMPGIARYQDAFDE